MDWNLALQWLLWFETIVLQLFQNGYKSIHYLILMAGIICTPKVPERSNFGLKVSGLRNRYSWKKTISGQPRVHRKLIMVSLNPRLSWLYFNVDMLGNIIRFYLVQIALGEICFLYADTQLGACVRLIVIV